MLCAVVPILSVKPIRVHTKRTLANDKTRLILLKQCGIIPLARVLLHRSILHLSAMVSLKHVDAINLYTKKPFLRLGQTYPFQFKKGIMLKKSINCVVSH